MISRGTLDWVIRATRNQVAGFTLGDYALAQQVIETARVMRVLQLIEFVRPFDQAHHTASASDARERAAKADPVSSLAPTPAAAQPPSEDFSGCDASFHAFIGNLGR